MSYIHYFSHKNMKVHTTESTQLWHTRGTTTTTWRGGWSNRCRKRRRRKNDWKNHGSDNAANILVWRCCRRHAPCYCLLWGRISRTNINTCGLFIYKANFKIQAPHFDTRKTQSMMRLTFAHIHELRALNTDAACLLFAVCWYITSICEDLIDWGNPVCLLCRRNTCVMTTAPHLL